MLPSYRRRAVFGRRDPRREAGGARPGPLRPGAAPARTTHGAAGVAGRRRPAPRPCQTWVLHRLTQDHGTRLPLVALGDRLQCRNGDPQSVADQQQRRSLHGRGPDLRRRQQHRQRGGWPRQRAFGRAAAQRRARPGVDREGPGGRHHLPDSLSTRCRAALQHVACSGAGLCWPPIGRTT